MRRFAPGSVPTYSIRTRILKDAMTNLFKAGLSCSNLFDPNEDTESHRFTVGVTRRRCSNLFDPNEDTESLCVFVADVGLRIVPTYSIRTRILKERGPPSSAGAPRGSNLFDPNEDTERF